MHAFPLLPIGLLVVWWNGATTYFNIFCMILIPIAGLFITSFLEYITEGKDWF